MNPDNQRHFYVESESLKIVVTSLKVVQEMSITLALMPILESLVESFECGHLYREYRMIAEARRYRWQSGHVVKFYRYKKGWSQKSLAEVARMHPSQISGIERNRIPIGKNVAKKLAHVLGCDYWELL